MALGKAAQAANAGMAALTPVRARAANGAGLLLQGLDESEAPCSMCASIVGRLLHQLQGGYAGAQELTHTLTHRSQGVVLPLSQHLPQALMQRQNDQPSVWQRLLSEVPLHSLACSKHSRPGHKWPARSIAKMEAWLWMLSRRVQLCDPFQESMFDIRVRPVTWCTLAWMSAYTEARPAASLTPVVSSQGSTGSRNLQVWAYFKLSAANLGY